jgi:hypothetical protein
LGTFKRSSYAVRSTPPLARCGSFPKHNLLSSRALNHCFENDQCSEMIEDRQTLRKLLGEVQAIGGSSTRDCSTPRFRAYPVAEYTTVCTLRFTVSSCGVCSGASRLVILRILRLVVFHHTGVGSIRPGSERHYEAPFGDGQHRRLTVTRPHKGETSRH